MIDVDEQHTEGLAFFHGHDLGGTQELIEGAAIRQARERVGFGALFRFAQRIADRVELARFLDEAGLQFRGTCGGFRQLVHQTLDEQSWINAGLAAIGDIADGSHLRAVIGNSRRQKLLRGGHDRMQLL